MRADVVLRGHRAHSARSWLGSNAVHAAGEVLRRLEAYDAEQVEIDGLVYREGLNAVGISGGVAGNVIPDECRVSINYRFAPSRSEGEAADVVRKVLEGYDVEVVDSAPGALPGLSHPAAAAFVAMVGREPQPKFGWTDVARFSALGVPAVNYGPGDPGVAHQREEYCDVAPILECEERMLAWLVLRLACESGHLLGGRPCFRQQSRRRDRRKVGGRSGADRPAGRRAQGLVERGVGDVGESVAVAVEQVGGHPAEQVVEVDPSRRPRSGTIRWPAGRVASRSHRLSDRCRRRRPGFAEQPAPR